MAAHARLKNDFTEDEKYVKWKRAFILANFNTGSAEKWYQTETSTDENCNYENPVSSFPSGYHFSSYERTYRLRHWKVISSNASVSDFCLTSFSTVEIPAAVLSNNSERTTGAGRFFFWGRVRNLKTLDLFANRQKKKKKKKKTDWLKKAIRLVFSMLSLYHKNFVCVECKLRKICDNAVGG